MKTKIFYLSVLFVFVLQGAFAQTLHTLNKDLPCLDRHFNLHAIVAVDSFRELNFDVVAFNQAVASMNKFFEPICVSFSLCDVDTIFNYNFDSIATTNEMAEIADIHQLSNRLNVYIITELLDENVCGLGGGGTIHLERRCYGSITHEMGHVWGLPHTFAGNGNENVDGSNCETTGDGICDTPADPFDPDDEDTVWQDGCEFIYTGLDANGQFYQPDMGNIMSYYGCDCGFTRGQYLRMANNIKNSGLW